MFGDTAHLKYTEREVLKVGFGERLRKRRKELGLRQEDIADHLGVRISTVSQWETSTHLPDIDTVQILAQYLRTSSDYLLGLTDEPSPSIQRSIDRTPASSDNKRDAEVGQRNDNSFNASVPFIKDERAHCEVETVITLLGTISSMLIELLSKTGKLSEDDKKRLIAQVKNLTTKSDKATLIRKETIDISDLDDEMKEDARKYIEWLRTKQKLTPSQDEMSAGSEVLDKPKAQGE